jgi:hypothetical protein
MEGISDGACERALQTSLLCEKNRKLLRRWRRNPGLIVYCTPFLFYLDWLPRRNYLHEGNYTNMKVYVVF